MNDTERLDWLERITENGACPALIFDDNGHWTVAFDGVQSVPSGDEPEDVSTSFFINAADWQPDLRAAIDAAYAKYEAEETE